MARSRFCCCRLSRTEMVYRGRELPCSPHRCRCRPPRYRSAEFYCTKIREFGDGESCVGCDFPCVTADEPVHHRTDHVKKFTLLQSTSTTSLSITINCSTSSFVRSSTLKGPGKVVVRSIALKISSEAIARGTRPASSFTSPSFYPV